MADKISLDGIDKRELFVALYNNSKPQGLGHLHFIPGDMSIEQAEDSFGECNGAYDYVHGRVIKVDLSGDVVNTWSYDRDNGQGAVQSIVDSLRD